jgi:hypothetical protein
MWARCWQSAGCSASELRFAQGPTSLRIPALVTCHSCAYRDLCRLLPPFEANQASIASQCSIIGWMFNCPKCSRQMEYVGSRPESDSPAKYFLYRCLEHGIYHFSNGTNFIPGLPPDD